jgi:uncharacterized repeat protein (TIGR03803 family)
LFGLLVLVAGASELGAQSYAYTSLHIFSPASVTSPQTNADGVGPHAGLILSSNTLYGTTSYGGSAGYGTVFKLNLDGSGFTTLYSFTNGIDGSIPPVGCALACSGNALFGVTPFGGTNSPRKGALFRINTDGTGFTNLHSFSGSDGQNPNGGLIVSGDTVYGTTRNGGGVGKHGTVFKLNTDGSGFASLYAFSTTDGSNPSAILLLSSNTLFGTTFYGSLSAGTVFRINTDGTGFTNLYTFNGGADGAWPYAGVALLGDWLFGTTSSGGTSNYGSVYRINTDGTGFTNLHSFTGGEDSGSPYAGLVVLGDTLYGTALVGRTNLGTVYKINAEGNGFTNVYNFTGGNDGGAPGATLLLSGNTLFGTADVGGSGYGTNGNGTIFGLTLPVSLEVSPSSTSLVLSWATPSTGFLLQTNRDLNKPSWGTFNTGIASDSTNQSVTISPAAGNLFFRLFHP